MEYDPKEASSSANVCSSGVITLVIRIPYQEYGSVRAYAWPNVLVSVSQHPTMLSPYFYLQPRDDGPSRILNAVIRYTGRDPVSVDVTLTSALHLV